MKLLSELFVNLCILGMLLFVFNLLTNKRKGFISPTKNVYRKLHFGGNMGLLGAILMHYTIQFNGTILDLRQIPVIISAIYGGFLPSVVASIIIAAGRIALFGLNKASIIASVLIIVVGTTCGALSKLRIGLLKKWLVMNVSNLLLTSIVFFLLISDKTVLANIYIGYWTVSLVGGFIILQLMKHLHQSKEMLQSAQEEAVKDYLTGLNNVRKFDEALKEAFKKADKHNEKVSFILMDIDHFKKINDSYGHPAGDSVLQQLSKVIAEASRSIDIVSRNGGEEFSVILPSCSRDQATEVAERIRSAVEKFDFLLPNGSSINITVSLGVSTYGETTFNRESVIKQSDDSLYHAKSTGRNKVVRASI